ncbi:PilN domain-containing protein [Pandoraea apista]|mgnify:CR=1 FL=1|uniref:PilN domain-containing protein n=1 Tax=Pandoraea apista TaxID=93218 RepID=UPI00248F244F|nr:PilN domain-containing protein [Pandoraea apista]
MRVSATIPPLDFLPTLAQLRQREFRRQWRLWACVAAFGALAALAPIARDIQLRREAQSQLAALRAASEKLSGTLAAFDVTGRKLAVMDAHRRATVALIERRQPVAAQLLDVMRACADGVRLTAVKSGDGQLRIAGYATTQSRVRETQKRLRALPWVRKVAEVESSVVPESVRRQWVSVAAQALVPNIRRFTLRIELKVDTNPVALVIGADGGAVSEEVPDVR